MMKKFIVYSLSFIVFITITDIRYTIYAADSTPSADIKAKLEELQKDIASKAAKLKLEVNRKLKDKAYIGTVKTKGPSSATLSTGSGPKIVSLNQDTLLPKKKIAEEDYLAALGDVDETEVLTAKKIILLNPIPSTLNPKTALWGQIVAISDKLVTLKGKDLKTVAVAVPGGYNIKLNDFVIITGSKNKNDIFVAEFVYVIPKGGILKSKKIASPSAKEATKSAN